MSSFWSAVKQIRSDKRFKNAPAPLDAVASRVRQLQKDLQLLRRACRADRDFCACLDNMISHNQKLPADIDKVARWCERLVGPFILYIEAFIKTSQAPASLSSLRKAPFVFLEEIKELLSQLEKMTSKSCGVSAVAAILSASRRMLTLQSSNEGLNDFVFNNVHCLGSGQGVSAAFNPVDIMERALFDVCIGDDKEIVAELLLLQSRGTRSLAVCEVLPFGQRSLMYPPFRGSKFALRASETTLTLSEGPNLIVMSAAPYVVAHWRPLLERLFEETERSASAERSNSADRIKRSGERAPKAPAPAISGLGIALGDEYDQRNDQEKFGDEFEEDFFEDERPSYNRPSEISASESLNALKRISVGMPVDFSEDLAKILRGIEEEEDDSAAAAEEKLLAPRPSTAPSAPAPVGLGIPSAQQSAAAAPGSLSAPKAPHGLDLLAPHAPFARSVPSLDPRSQGGSPASFFSEFTPRSRGTPSSVASSPRTLDEADAARKRIAARISSREKERSQERYFSPVSQEESLQSIQISDSEDDEEIAAAPSIDHQPVASQPPSIPAPVYAAQRATVVRVSTPRRINFGSDAPEYVPISNDLSVVDLSEEPREAAAAGSTSKAASASMPSLVPVQTKQRTASSGSASKPREAVQIPLRASQVPTSSSAKTGPVLRPATAPTAPAPVPSAVPQAAPVSAPASAPAPPSASSGPYKHSAQSQPALPRPNAPQRPRIAHSVYSPKIGTPVLPRSHSDERHSQQQDIWFEEPSKVKSTFANFFKKKRTPKTQQSPKFKGSERKSSGSANGSANGGANGSASTNVTPAVSNTEFVPSEPDFVPPPVPTAAPVAIAPKPISAPLGTMASPAPTQAPPPVPVQETQASAPTTALPPSHSLRSLQSAGSTSEPDLGASLGNRASTIFYKRISKMNRDSFCPAPSDSSSSARSAEAAAAADENDNDDATAVCVDSHNQTAAPSCFNSVSSSLNNSQSYASLESKVTMSTANTSFGSAKAWSDFMDGVKETAASASTITLAPAKVAAPSTSAPSAAEELKRLEAEVESKKLAIQEAASRVREIDLSRDASSNTIASAGSAAPSVANSTTSVNTLDPGMGMSANVNRSVPILRELYAEKDKPAPTTSSIYSNPNAFSSVPALPSIQPLNLKKANSVTFSEPTTPTSITTTQFSGFLWVSKWTVNRWMPLSQKELPVEVLAAEEQDSIVIAMPGSARPVKLRFNCDCDLRVSNAHDVEVRVKGEVYMFRSRSSQRCKKFFKAIEGLQVDLQDLGASTSATSLDSDTSSGSTHSSGSARRCAPPKLNNYGPLASRTNISHYPIIEE